MAEKAVSSEFRGTIGVPVDFLNSNLRGRRRRMYEGDRLEALRQEGSIGNIWRRLYPRQPEGDRLSLERNLRQDCVKELASIFPLLPPKYQSFYRTLLLRFQMDNILVLLRLFYGGSGDAVPESFVRDLPDVISCDAGDLLSSAGLDAFLGKLPKLFSEGIRPAVELTEHHGSPAFVEMAIEKCWWNSVVQVLGDIPARYRDECADPVRYELNSKRLLTVLRAARHYDVRWEDVEPLLPHRVPSLHSGCVIALSQDQLQELFKAPTSANVEALLGSGEIEKGQGKSLAELEDRLWQNVFKRANRLYYGVLEGPAILVSYYYVRLNELKNLVKTVESIHYQTVKTG